MSAIKITEIEAQEHPQRYWYLTAAVLLLAGVWLRLVNVLEIPMFIDEVRHIVRAQEILTGDLFEGLPQNKWLWGFIFAGLNPTGPEAGWLARYFNILWATISIAGTIYLGRILGSRWIGLLAGLIYVVVPIATFHERQALVDPMMTAFTTLSMVASVALARSIWRRDAPITLLTLILTGSLLAARLVKPAMLPFLVLPPVAFLLLGVLPTDQSPLRWLAQRWNQAYTPLTIWVAAVATTLLATYAVYWFAETEFDVTPTDKFQATFSNTIISGAPDVEQGTLLDDITVLTDASIKYMGWVVVGGIGAAIVFAGALRYKWRAVVFLACPAILFMVVPLLADRLTGSGEIATRYLLLNVSALAVLAAIGIGAVVQQAAQIPYGAPAVALLLVAGILYQNLQFNYVMITNPRQANWTAYDQRVYFDSSNSGYYFERAAQFLLRTYERSDSERLHVLSDVELLRYAQTTLGPRVGEMQFLVQEDFDEQRELIAEWLIAGDTIIVLENTGKDDFIRDTEYLGQPVGPEGLLLRRAYTWRTPDSRQNAYIVEGATDPMASYIYDQLGDDPELYPIELQNIGPVITGSPADIIAVFPTEHTTFVAQETSKPVVRLQTQVYPLNPEDVQQAVAQIPLEPGETLGIVLFEPPTVDPQQVIASTMFEEAYTLPREYWNGPFNYRLYTLEAYALDTQPIDVIFEDAITLETALVRRVFQEMLQIEVTWQTNAPIEDEYFTFTHVLDENGELVLQRDGIPGGGLLPMTQWFVDQPVTDRYAIPLPPTLTAGTYTVISGIYDPASSLRLQTTSAAGEGDHAVIGRFVLSE